jgi:hypothetical protein
VNEYRVTVTETGVFGSYQAVYRRRPAPHQGARITVTVVDRNGEPIPGRDIDVIVSAVDDDSPVPRLTATLVGPDESD